jgi:HK97 family phage portal protein
VSFLRRLVERRDLFSSAGGYGYAAAAGLTVPSNVEGGWGAASSGQVVSDRTAFGLPVFYACVRLLADTVASLPWDAYRKRGDVRVEVDPQPSLLAQPAPEMTDFDFKHMIVTSLATRGNFYADTLERDGLGYPTSFQPMHPDEVRIDRDPDTGQRRWWRGGHLRRMEDLFHIPFLRPPGCDVGLSPIGAARHSLGLGLAAQSYGAQWFRDGAAPSSVLETDAQMSPDGTRDLQKQWVTTHGGRRLPAVLSGGIKYRAITITPEESQFLQTRQYQDLDVCKLMGVPPHMVSIVDKSTSWGTGIEQQSIGFVTYSLRNSYLNRIEAAFNRCLPRGQYTRFNINALLRGDIKSRFEAYGQAIQDGWLNPDEVRAYEELAPIPGGAGAKYRQPLNFGPLGYDPNEETQNDAGTSPVGANAGDAGVARLRPVRGPVAGA